MAVMTIGRARTEREQDGDRRQGRRGIGKGVLPETLQDIVTTRLQEAEDTSRLTTSVAGPGFTIDDNGENH